MSFNQNQITEASKLFQQSLHVLKTSNESNAVANQRILAKLANTTDILSINALGSMPIRSVVVSNVNRIEGLAL